MTSAIEYFQNVAKGLSDALSETFIREFDEEGWREQVQEELDMVKAAIAALREQGWVKTSERLPAEADTGDAGTILCVTVGVLGDTVILHVFWGIVAERPERYPYWMPLPPLPEVEG